MLKILEALNVLYKVFLPATNVFNNDSMDLSYIILISVASL